MLPGCLSFAKLDIVLGRVRKTVGGKLMFNQDSGSRCPVPSRVAWVGGVLKGRCLPHQTSTVTPLSQGTSMSWLSVASSSLACPAPFVLCKCLPTHTQDGKCFQFFMLISILNMLG